MLLVLGQIGVVLELGQVLVLIGVAGLIGVVPELEQVVKRLVPGLIDVVVPGPEVEILKVPGQIVLKLWRPDFLVPPWHWVESDVVR